MTLLLASAFFLSGLCALIYETIWIYWLSRIFGSTVLAMSLVVAVFFAGLAVGARVFGRRSSRTPRPLLLYGFLEIGIGLCALLFPGLLALVDWAYGLAWLRLGSAPGLLTVLRMILSAALILPPTLLMGGTLPALLAHCADRVSTLGWRAGLLYGMNTLGAASGSFLTGWVLLEAWGARATNALAGGLNLAVGLLALGLSRRQPGREAAGCGEGEPGAEGVRPAFPARTRRLVRIAFALSGFAAMGWEVLWLRHLGFFFHETIRVYTGVLALFILGLGLGSLLCGWWVARMRHPLTCLGLLQAGSGLWTCGAIYGSVAGFQTFYRAGQESDLLTLLVLAGLLLGPALLMGASFPLVARILVGDPRAAGEELGRACAWNTLGCILGLLSVGFVLQRFLGLQATLYILLGLNLGLAAVLLAAEGGRLRVGWATLPPLLGLGAGLLVWGAQLQLPHSILRQMQAPGEEILELREGLLGFTWASRGAGSKEVHLWSNGVRISRGGQSTFLAQGFIPLLLAPRIPREVLGLAFGAGLSYRGARLFPQVRRLDFVDLSRDNIEVALRNFPENAGLGEDPRARFLIEDAYSFLKHGHSRYELILMEPTPPRFSFQTAALYTSEFYAHGCRRLSPEGLFVQVLALKDFSLRETRSILRTFSSVFPHCLLWRNGWDCLMLGSNEPFRLDLAEISARLVLPRIQQGLRQGAPSIERYWILENLLSGLLLADEDFRAAAEGGECYTDDRNSLRYTTGREVNSENIRLIQRHLTPWAQARRLFTPAARIEALEKVLARKRAYFMARLYEGEPGLFVEVYLAYIREHSLEKRRDLEALIDFMTAKGQTERADEVLQYLEQLSATGAEAPANAGTPAADPDEDRR